MRNFFRGAPWPASTIAIISVLFTPAVGGIIAGIREARMGYPEQARRSYGYSAISFTVLILWLITTDHAPGGLRSLIWRAIFDIGIVSRLLASILGTLFMMWISFGVRVIVLAVFAALVVSNYAKAYTAWRSSRVSDTVSEDASA